MALQLQGEDLDNKTILEVGCGQGYSVRPIAVALTRAQGAELILTDINDSYFGKIGHELDGIGVKHRFIHTDACRLAGIGPCTVDFITCSFVLCAVNADTGSGTIALEKFHSVLKPGGKLYIKEEYPLHTACGVGQECWARTFQLMKSARILSSPHQLTTEYRPEVLSRLCEIAGFRVLSCSDDLTRTGSAEFMARLNVLQRMLPDFPDQRTAKAFTLLADEVRQHAEEVEWVEIPRYDLVVEKPNRP